MPAFEFDLHKNEVNIDKHGVSLEEAKSLWSGTHIIIPAKNVKDEQRFFIIGKLGSKVYVAIFTEREGTIRLISCHRADKKLERYYYEKIK